jgi:polyhydroxyalkanoate synthesis repressor PhaR
MRLIKRYNNRKLYDTTTRTYITLEGLRNFVVEGEEIKVVDNDTDDDLTTVVLSQMILERERAGRFLPTGVLSQLLRTGSETGRKLTSLARPFVNVSNNAVPQNLRQFLEQEIERSFKFWLDLAQSNEDDVLRLLERLIEQRRRTKGDVVTTEPKNHEHSET